MLYCDRMFFNHKNVVVVCSRTHWYRDKSHSCHHNSLNSQKGHLSSLCPRNLLLAFKFGATEPVKFFNDAYL